MKKRLRTKVLDQRFHNSKDSPMTALPKSSTMPSPNLAPALTPGIGGMCTVTALTHASWFSLVDIRVGRGSSLQWTLLTLEKRVEAYW